MVDGVESILSGGGLGQVWQIQKRLLDGFPYFRRLFCVKQARNYFRFDIEALRIQTLDRLRWLFAILI